MLPERDPRHSLEQLQRRLDEVRSLVRPGSALAATETADPPELLDLALELTEELERSQRQLIETQVQLVSLHEVAGSLFTTHGSEEGTRVICRYLLRAFPFHQVFLCLADPERSQLTGIWMGGEAGPAGEGHALRISLVEETGIVGRAIWQNRLFTVRDPRLHPALTLDLDDPLAEAMGRLTSYAVIPLQRNRMPARYDEGLDACPRQCPLRFGGRLDDVPPPEPELRWAEQQASRRRRCLECNCFPVLGVLGVATTELGPGLSAADLAQLDSVALTVAPILENAQLYHDLRVNQRFLDHVLNSIGAGLVAVGLNGRLLTVNRAAEELTGHRAGYAVGEPLELVFPEAAAQLVRTALRSGRLALREETHVRRAGGEEVPVSLTTSLLRDEAGRVYGAVVAFSDLTRIRRMEERIRQLDRLAALGRFTTSVAHELRNPLAGIAAGVEYLGKSAATRPADAEHLHFIRREISRLDRIIGDLFLVTHPKRLSPRLVDVRTLLEYSLQGVQSLVAERSLDVALDVPLDLPLASVDPDQMQQVFLNLLKNAAEDSPPEGRIRVLARVGPPAGDTPRPLGERALFVEVEDEGPGIPAETASRIFEPFFTTKPAGTGLGLYVSHDIVKRHGGSLKVRSRPGEGALFTVELPLDPTMGEPDA
jgi:PAS domain S-box-containing protein